MNYWVLSASGGESPLRDEFQPDEKVDLPPTEGLSEDELRQWGEVYAQELFSNTMRPRAHDAELFRIFDNVGLQMSRKIAQKTGNKVKYFSAFLGVYLSRPIGAG